MDQATHDRMQLELEKHGELKATPEAVPIAAVLGRSLHKFHQFASKPFGYNNPPGQMVSEALGIPAMARTLERVGYGEPLTTGKGMTTKPRDDTADVAMLAASFAPLIGRGGAKVAKAAGEGLTDRMLAGKGLIPGLPGQPPVSMFAVSPQKGKPFWYNPEGGKFAAFEEKGMHNKVIQDPEFTSKLGTTTEDAMKETSPMLMGRHRGSTLDLMQVASPTHESLNTIRNLVESQKLSPENVNFSAGENLFENIPRDELLKAAKLEELEKYKKYKDGGAVEGFFPDKDQMQLELLKR
jgi:hypothetical protein